MPWFFICGPIWYWAVTRPGCAAESPAPVPGTALPSGVQAPRVVVWRMSTIVPQLSQRAVDCAAASGASATAIAPASMTSTRVTAAPC